jgi:ferrochelatase
LQSELRRFPETSNARVVVAMRYWKPFTEEAIAELVREQVTEIVLLPLYPQYSKTTTGSSYNEWNRHLPASPLADVQSTYIKSFHDHPGYVDCFVAGVNETLKRFPSPREVHLVFSAHGIPTAVVQSGDPYKQQIEETTRLVLERGRWNLPWTLCWQSKVGSGRWIQPSIHEIVGVLGGKGIKNLLVVPISFVSDHIETIHELGEEVRAEATAAGVERFELMPGLNDSPAFIAALADLVYQRVRNSPQEAHAIR